MFKLVSTAVAVALLSGCGMISTKPISPEKFTELKGKNLAVTSPIEMEMKVLTIGGAMIEGLTVFNADRDSLTEHFGLADPSISISKNVEKNLVKKSKIKSTEHKRLNELSRDPAEILGQFEKSDYVLDINTVYYSFTYKPFDFGSYKLTYTSKLQLFEANTQTVVAESICQFITDDEKSISYDEFLENKAKLLRNEFSLAGKKCTREFSKSILRI